MQAVTDVGEIQVVEIPDSERCANAALIEPFDFVDGFLNLGSDGEHTHLAIKPGDDSIYIVADATEEDHLSDTYASVDHWIVFIERREGMLTEYWAKRGKGTRRTPGSLTSRLCARCSGFGHHLLEDGRPHGNLTGEWAAV